jgi:hypothetical protein
MPKGTDAATALADSSPLSPFDGKQVVRSTIAVTNAGDGLSDALGIDPQEFHHGDTVYVVLECEVAKVSLVPVDKDTPGILLRQHTLRAGTGTIVDGDLVAEQVARQAERIDTARRRAKGEYTLDENALLEEHEQQQHTDLRPGCPLCDEEAAAAAAEAG